MDNEQLTKENEQLRSQLHKETLADQSHRLLSNQLKLYGELLEIRQKNSSITDFNNLFSPDTINRLFQIRDELDKIETELDLIDYNSEQRNI